MSRTPVAADLCAGLGGFSEGLIAEGWTTRGYDIEAHEYDGERYPGELILRNVLEMHGSELADVDLIVASPPCVEFSYMAMPWTRGKQIARALRGEDDFPLGYTGSRTLADLTAIFDACFRLQREASEWAGRYIPMVVENVRGAQPWIGKARANYGSFYFWGDVPALMPAVSRYGPTDGNKRSGRTMCYPAGSSNPEAVKGRTGKLHWQDDGQKVAGFRFDESGRSFQSASVAEAVKAPNGTRWFNGAPRNPDSLATSSSKSPARKAASARIAKIPFAVSSHLGRVFRLRM